jgi:hypothetical protein
MLIFNTLIFALTLIDFLALHDIGKDYLSSETLEVLGISTALPAWTATEGEWQILTISFVLRVLFLLSNIFLLWYLLRKEEKVS